MITVPIFFLVAATLLGSLSAVQAVNHAEAKIKPRAEPITVRTGTQTGTAFAPIVDHSPSRFLAALNGVELTWLFGTAAVESATKNDLGEQQDPIAAGFASQTGYKISINSIPNETGFYWSPSAGLLAQNISIVDFSEVLPDTPASDGSINIEAVCSHPGSGAGIDCGAPNSYNLIFSSLFVGAEVGYNWLIGSPQRFHLSLGASVAGTLLEYRSLNAALGVFATTRNEFSWASTLSRSVHLGVSWPKIHLALHYSVEFSNHQPFTYAKPIEFRGSAAYDPARNTLVRPRSFVENVSLETITSQIGVSYVY